MKFKTLKKGFTIVELVIVIAVIGVLAAVLIPVFMNLTQKANEASDQSLVKNLNTVLAIAESEPGYEKSENPSDMFKVLERKGYIGETLIKDHKSDKVILYNLPKNRFLFEENKNSAEFSGSLPQDFWTFGLTPDTTGYSTFLYKEYSSSEPITVTSGLDVGLNDELTQITYNPGTGVSKDVIIRTNGENLRIDAPLSSVKHFGNASVLVIDAIKSSSYHEFGTVGNAQIKTGRIVIENQNASIDNLLLVAKTDKSGFEDIVLQTKAGAALPALDRTDVNIHPNGTLVLNVVTPTSDEYVYLTKAGVIEQIVVTNEDVDTTTKNVTEAETAKPVEDTSEKTQVVAEQIANVGKKNDQGQYVDSEDNVIEIEDLTIDNIVIEEEKADEEAIETGTTLFAGGAGTLKSPYLISNPTELSNIRECFGAYYVVTNDIDMKGVTDWNPIGTSESPFYGHLDGNNHSVCNWNTNKSLFEYVRGEENNKLTDNKLDVLNDQNELVESNISEDNYTAVIKNLNFSDSIIRIKANSNNGTLAHYALDCFIDNCEIANCKITIESAWRSGIMVGETFKSHLKNLHLADNNEIVCVNNPSYLGNFGLIIGCIYDWGQPNSQIENYNPDLNKLYRTIIDSCVNDASVQLNKTYDTGFLGGVLGCVNSHIANQVIYNCVNNGNIVVNNLASKMSVSGICGAHMGGKYINVVNCTNNGDITLIGNASLSNASGYDQISGICSYGAGPYINCTNNGSLTGEVEYIGGVCAHVPSNGATLHHINCTNNGVLKSTYASALIGSIFGTVSATSSVSATTIYTTPSYSVILNEKGSGTLVVPSTLGKIQRNGTFGYSAVDLSNVNGTLELIVSNATIDLLGNNPNASFTIIGDNNVVNVKSDAVLNNIRARGNSSIINRGSVQHLTIIDSTQECVNEGLLGSVEFVGDNHLSMRFVNNGTIGQPDQNWHTVQTQNQINLTFTNNGVIRGYGEKYALLFYGLSDVVFNAGYDSLIVVENPIYTAVFYNTDSMRANSVTFNAEIGADGTTVDSYYGISNHETGGTQISVNIVTGYYIDLNWTQKMLNTRAQVVGGDYNDCYASSDANHCTSNGVACSASYRYILKVSENYSHNNDKPFRIAVVFYNSTTGQITEIIGSGVPAVYFGDVVSAGNTLTFVPSSSESDRFYITGWYATATNEPDVYSENISVFAERIVENN